MTGVLLAVPPADFLVHNSMFLVAHFHNVIIGGVVFGVFAGIEYWFPKAFGFRLQRALGQGGLLVRLHRLLGHLHAALHPGPAGHDPAAAAHRRRRSGAPWLYLSAVGVVILAVGVICQVIQLVVSIRDREKLRDVTGDPWDGRSLEWATPSPAPFFNFAVMPNVEGEEAYWRHQGAGDRGPAAGPRAEVPADPDAGEQPDRLLHRLLRHHHRLRPDLADLVAGGARAAPRLHRRRDLRLA